MGRRARFSPQAPLPPVISYRWTGGFRRPRHLAQIANHLRALRPAKTSRLAQTTGAAKRLGNSSSPQWRVSPEKWIRGASSRGSERGTHLPVWSAIPDATCSLAGLEDLAVLVTRTDRESSTSAPIGRELRGSRKRRPQQKCWGYSSSLQRRVSHEKRPRGASAFGSEWGNPRLVWSVIPHAKTGGTWYAMASEGDRLKGKIGAGNGR